MRDRQRGAGAHPDSAAAHPPRRWVFSGCEDHVGPLQGPPLGHGGSGNGTGALGGRPGEGVPLWGGWPARAQGPSAARGWVSAPRVPCTGLCHTRGDRARRGLPLPQLAQGPGQWGRQALGARARPVCPGGWAVLVGTAGVGGPLGHRLGSVPQGRSCHQPRCLAPPCCTPSARTPAPRCPHPKCLPQKHCRNSVGSGRSALSCLSPRSA